MPDARFDTAYGFKPNIGSYGGTDSRVDRTMAVRYNDIINVKDFGATGNGSTDDTAAIRSAISAAWELGFSSLPGATVYFPPGTYLIGSPPLYLDMGAEAGKTHGAFIMYCGAGRDVTTLIGNYGTGEDMEDDNNGFLVQFGYRIITSAISTATRQVLGLRDLTISNTSTVRNSGALMIMASGNNLNISNCHFHGYVGLSHSSNVFVASLRNSVLTCSVPYTACNAATKAPEYTNAKFLPSLSGAIIGVTKINGTTARVTTSVAHGLPAGSSKVNIFYLTPLTWTPNGKGSERLTVTNTGASTFDYPLAVSPSPVDLSPGPSFSQSQTFGTVGLYSNSMSILNCIFEGFDAGMSQVGNCIVYGNKFYRCGAGVFTGLVGGSPYGVSEGLTVRPQPTYYLKCDGWTMIGNWIDRCHIGAYYRNNGVCVQAAHRISGPDGPWDAAAIQGISPSGTLATVTTTANHNLPVGTTRLYLRVTPSTFTPDGSGSQDVIVTNTAANQFTYPLTGTPTFTSGTWNYCPDYGVVGTTSIGAIHIAHAIEVATNVAGFSCDYPSVQAFENQNNVAIGMTGTTWVSPAQSQAARCSWRFVKCGNASSFPGMWATFAFDRPGAGGNQKGPYMGQTFTFTDCAAQPTFGGTITSAGGPSNRYKARYDGTNWIRVG